MPNHKSNRKRQQQKRKNQKKNAKRFSHNQLVENAVLTWQNFFRRYLALIFLEKRKEAFVAVEKSEKSEKCGKKMDVVDTVRKFIYPIGFLLAFEPVFEDVPEGLYEKIPKGHVIYKGVEFPEEKKVEYKGGQKQSFKKNYGKNGKKKSYQKDKNYGKGKFKKNAQGSNKWKREKINFSGETVEVLEVQRLLNRLAPENFDALFQQIVDTCFSHERDIEVFVDLFFKKVIKEPLYSDLYSKLATRLSQVAHDRNVDFRTILLKRCQVGFVEREVPPSITAGLSKEEEIDIQIMQTKIREQNMGMMAFVGDLFNHKLLGSKIIAYCIKQLLEPDEDGNYDLNSLDYLCKLLPICGQQIDSGKYNPFMNSQFEKIASLTRNQSIPRRNRFLLMGLIDLRNQSWHLKA